LVAWEGSGAARAASFNKIGSLELRAVTEATDKEAPQDFAANLPTAMENLAEVLVALFEEPGRDEAGRCRKTDSPSPMPTPR
jgi:nucleoside phosphorylase